MENLTRIFFIGPISPPFNGPGIKNQIIFEELKKHNRKIFSFNTLQQKKIQFSFHLLRNLFVQKTIILSVSKKGRFILTPLILITTLLSKKRTLILIPAGGKLHEELKKLPYLIMLFYIKILGHFDKVIVETNSLKLGLEKLGINSIKIPNPRKIITLDKKTKNKDEISVFFISSIKKEKGIIDAIDAIELLNSKGYNVKLVIHGRIMTGFEIEFYDALKSSPNTLFKGGLENEQVVKTLAKNADFLILPTYYPGEGLPGVLVESTIAEVPFLVTEIDGLDDYFTDNHSMKIIKQKNPKHIAKQLEELILDKDKYNEMIVNLKQKKETFSVSNYVNQIL